MAPLLGLVGVLALTVLAVAVFRVPQTGAGAEEAVEAPGVSSAGTEAEPEVEPEDAPVALTVVGSGLRVERILQGTEFGFFSETGVGVNILDLASPGLVWELTNDNRNGADIIEVGFRLDALSGSGDDSLLPIDPAQIPNLAQVDQDLLLDAHGIVPYIDGAVGLFLSGPNDQQVSDWVDLQAAVDRGATVVVPAPPTDLAVVFVWALGSGDPELGLERYTDLIAGGAHAVGTTSDLVDIIASGPVVGAWSSAGVVRAQRTVSDIEFLVPTSGVVALPGFAGILAETEHPEEAHRWLDFRLDTTLQSAMTFEEVTRQLDRDPPVPPLPVIDLERDARAIVGFDLHDGDAFVVMNWSAVGASASDVTAALEEIVGEAN